jgi:hypothetical protein
VWAIWIAVSLGVLVAVANAVDKPLWDWLQLLIVPAVIAAGVAWFSQQQREREQRTASERAQDEALQAYLNQMSQLLPDKERPLRAAGPYDDVAVVAWAQTQTVLPRLDVGRKVSVVRFLHEAKLLDAAGPAKILFGLDLSGINLSGRILRHISLPAANLVAANLSGANLSKADLRGANLSKADLRDAKLRGANLSCANLSGADLRGADLRDGDLSLTAMRKADLNGADGITNEVLDEKAGVLDGATMPDGQKYEEWVKSRGEGR